MRFRTFGLPLRPPLSARFFSFQFAAVSHSLASSRKPFSHPQQPAAGFPSSFPPLSPRRCEPCTAASPPHDAANGEESGKGVITMSIHKHSQTAWMNIPTGRENKARCIQGSKANMQTSWDQEKREREEGNGRGGGVGNGDTSSCQLSLS